MEAEKWCHAARYSKVFSGGNPEFNPFYGKGPDGIGPSPVFEYGRALEGARGCMRACMNHLEEQGKIRNAFADMRFALGYQLHEGEEEP